MLLMLAVTVSLFALAVYAIAKATQAAMARLGVDLMEILLWLGLAERPIEARPRRASGPRACEVRRVGFEPTLTGT